MKQPLSSSQRPWAEINGRSGFHPENDLLHKVRIRRNTLVRVPPEMVPLILRGWGQEGGGLKSGRLYKSNNFAPWDFWGTGEIHLYKITLVNYQTIAITGEIASTWASYGRFNENSFQEHVRRCLPPLLIPASCQGGEEYHWKKQQLTWEALGREEETESRKSHLGRKGQNTPCLGCVRRKYCGSLKRNVMAQNKIYNYLT